MKPKGYTPNRGETLIVFLLGAMSDLEGNNGGGPRAKDVLMRCRACLQGLPEPWQGQHGGFFRTIDDAAVCGVVITSAYASVSEAKTLYNISSKKPGKIPNAFGVPQLPSETEA